MDNKETLNQHNTRINVNNEELASILITINKLPTVKEEKLQDKVVEPSTTEQTITADEEYTSLGSVTVNAVTNEIDSNIVAENIKDGVEILGVKGSFVGGKYAPRYINGYQLFYNYKGTELDYEVANLDVSNVTNVKEMFRDCTEITKLDLSNWFISNVNDMTGFFDNCQKLTELIIFNLEVTDASINSIGNMFYNCKNLISLDLSNFNTSNVWGMYGTFYGCQSLKYLDIRNFTFDKVSSYTNMFRSVPTDCLIIVKGDTEKEWITSKFTTLTNVKTVAEYEAS